MKKLFVFLLILLSNPVQNCNAIEWDHGVAIIDGIPKYFDPAKIDIPSMEVTPEFSKNFPSEILPAYTIIWVQEEKNGFLLYTYDENIKTHKSVPNSEKVYHAKITENSLYISNNQSTYEKIEIKFLNRIPYKGRGVMVWWKVYLKCKWFEGEYEIISTALGS